MEHIETTTNNTSFNVSYNSYWEISAWITIPVHILTAIQATIGIILNTLFIIALIHFPQLRTNPAILLCNKAIADLILCISSVITAIFLISTEIRISLNMCILKCISMFGTNTVHIGILLMIAVERFVCVLKPLEYKHIVTLSRTLMGLALLWILSYGTIGFLIHILEFRPSPVGERYIVFCGSMRLFVKEFEYAHLSTLVILLSVTYCFNLATVILLQQTTNTLRSSCEVNTNMQAYFEHKQRQVTKMALFVTFIFPVLYFPPLILKWKVMSFHSIWLRILRDYSFLLYMTNFWISPLIVFMKHKTYRRIFYIISCPCGQNIYDENNDQ